MPNRKIATPEAWLGALVLATGIVAATHVQAEGDGYCGASSCDVLNNPLVPCFTTDNHCDVNPGGMYYIHCCPFN